jgi:hypothetical protein
MAQRAVAELAQVGTGDFSTTRFIAFFTWGMPSATPSSRCPPNLRHITHLCTPELTEALLSPTSAFIAKAPQTTGHRNNHAVPDGIPAHKRKIDARFHFLFGPPIRTVSAASIGQSWLGLNDDIWRRGAATYPSGSTDEGKPVGSFHG